MRIGICQLKTESEKALSLAKAEKMVAEAADKGAELVVLPEMFQCPYDTMRFDEFSEEYPHSQSVCAMSRWAKENRIYLIGGSIPEKSEGKLYNTSFTFAPDGSVIGRHRKLHLFDISVPGRIRFMESDVLTCGSEATVIDTKFGKIGVAICFDMRFPELIRGMALMGARLIVAPAAFNLVTGPAHWELTARARAVDSQSFFLAVSGARDMEFSYHAYGHSMLVDPWGTVLVEMDEKEGVTVCNADMDAVDRVRLELPLLRSVRKDIYASAYSDGSLRSTD